MKAETKIRGQILPSALPPAPVSQPTTGQDSTDMHMQLSALPREEIDTFISFPPFLLDPIS
jgi:hypothetical protein